MKPLIKLLTIIFNASPDFIKKMGINVFIRKNFGGIYIL